MTPATIIREAQADGVRLALSPTGTIKATGDGAAVNRWLAVIREHKTEIIEVLKVGAGATAASERVAIAKAIEERLKEKAQERQKAGIRIDLPEKFPEGIGDSRDLAAERVAIAKAIEERLAGRVGRPADEIPEKFPELPKGDSRDLAAERVAIAKAIEERLAGRVGNPNIRSNCGKISTIEEHGKSRDLAAERVAIAKAIEERLAERHGKNQHSKEDVEKFPHPEEGRSRDLAAKRACFGSGKTYEAAPLTADEEARAYFLQRAAAELPKPDPFPDDRRTCDQCANLIARRCMAAKRGEIVAGRNYEPVRDLPRRCEGYAPGADDPDRRHGRERWPGLIQKGGE